MEQNRTVHIIQEANDMHLLSYLQNYLIKNYNAKDFFFAADDNFIYKLRGGTNC